MYRLTKKAIAQRKKLEAMRLGRERARMARPVEERAPLTMAEVKMVGTYAPEGVTDDDVEILVRKIEQMHGLTHNA